MDIPCICIPESALWLRIIMRSIYFSTINSREASCSSNRWRACPVLSCPERLWWLRYVADICKNTVSNTTHTMGRRLRSYIGNWRWKFPCILGDTLSGYCDVFAVTSTSEYVLRIVCERQSVLFCTWEPEASRARLVNCRWIVPWSPGDIYSLVIPRYRRCFGMRWPSRFFRFANAVWGG